MLVSAKMFNNNADSDVAIFVECIVYNLGYYIHVCRLTTNIFFLYLYIFFVLLCIETRININIYLIFENIWACLDVGHNYVQQDTR